ncbi:hypothetical protein [Halobacillus yeomjeoni]|uniref:Uncharacterized protein n=1 Tax=Halobacillus yeomjeoni TaxID=311194 RepID=A0A931HY22_9BACI|nr:hypothetical protein [Halobacillus yeomjeoni]MBH0231356.1 hypothetical protein [Halobacillus yeomjeoni]
MFGFTDIIKLLLSAFIILPTVSIIREVGYLVVTHLFGVKSSKVTVGCGPVLFRRGVFEIRKYYFMYSWCSHTEIDSNNRWVHLLIYASPIISTIAAAVLVNSMAHAGWLQPQGFWEQFIFYALYFLLFDVLPIYYPDGKPSNGRVVYDLLRHHQLPDFQRQNY